MPLIHCITNPISINLCANGVLAVGARPMMAEHPKEATEVVKTADALVVNLGNITDARRRSIRRAARCATKENLPFVLDLVGVACSTFRKKYALRLLAKTKPAILKGNYSEIQAMYQKDYQSSGVDADQALTAQQMCRSAAALSRKYHAVVLASGKEDIVTDGTRTFIIKNGTPSLQTVTGTGCLLGALCGCYLSQAESLWAAITACMVLGIAGELAEDAPGSGSFAVKLMDQLSTLDLRTWGQAFNLQEQDHEAI